MKRILLFIPVFFTLSTACYASHIFGGEMIYEYLATNGSLKKYRITLKLFRDDLGGGAQLPTDVYIGIFDYGTKEHYPNTIGYYDVPRTSGPTSITINVSPCATGNTGGLYSVAEYSFIVDLPDNAQGYICAYETCCRINGLANVNHPGGVGGTGSTYVCRIPGTNQLPANQHNSSPKFVTNLDLVCKNSFFSWNFSALDPDGDSLVYSFTPGYNKTLAQDASNIAPAPPSSTPPPDYPLLTYINGFTGFQPLGNNVTINPSTGIISGIAPAAGLYVTSVIIKEYRNGVQISEHRKDFILRVQDCDIPQAALQPQYINCNDFTVTFQNLTPSPLINSYYWKFGVPGQTGDTSNLPQPTFTYPDTGTYVVKLITNRHQQCSDSAISLVKVYPGFHPDFSFTGICINKPTQFTDLTTASYGTVNSWNWNFGDGSLSTLQNPQHTYSTAGGKTVQLVVTSSKGCVDTSLHIVDMIDKPPITLAFRDTLICTPDQLQLNASGQGVFSWTPLTNIINANTGTPTVNPTTTTTYYVNLNNNSCINIDSVRVRVVGFVTLKANNDTTVCGGDPVQLGAQTNGLSFSWTPAASLNNPNLLNPIATPAVTTKYRLFTTIGSCSASDSMTVFVVPYPGSNAGPDDTICYNTSKQLSGTIVGSSFSWSPSSSLLNANTLTPIAYPPRTTAYVLTVYDTIGCPKPGRDTIVVTVTPKMHPFAGRDTSVVAGQPLQFNASGGVSYLWSPSDYLSATDIPNPIGIYPAEISSIRYKVVMTNSAGCFDSAYVKVKIFRTGPSVFVPTAFTPNGDGLNDVIRPIAVGIQKIEYFSIYNRWGQLVFTTTINGEGWNGKIGGKDQGSGVFVWMVKAIDYLGKPYFAKGTVTLIR
jgi:gliding motility-associated-like protein